MTASLDMASAEELVAPGTPLREGLEAVVAAGAGALVTVGDEHAVALLGDGGFEIGHPFTPQGVVRTVQDGRRGDDR